MKGADEYYNLFKGQSQLIGRLFLQMHTHARGKCFEIFVLPESAELTGLGYPPKGSVEVYGVTNGQRGWTETYGWLKKGKWQDDFNALVNERREEIIASNAARSEDIHRAAVDAKSRDVEVLGSY